MADSKYSEEKLAELLEDAHKQGLPLDWTLSVDENGRKRWTSGKGKAFSYLQRALDFANGTSKKKGGKKRPASASASGAKTVDSTKMKISCGKKPKKLKRAGTSSNSTSTSKASQLSSANDDGLHSQKQKLHSYDVESDPETSLELPPDFDESNLGNHEYNRCAGTVHWDPNSPAGSKVGYRIRVYDFVKSYWKSGRIVRYDPISHKHKVIFFNSHDPDASPGALEGYREEWIHLDRENIQLGGKFVWALVKGFAWWPAQVLHCKSFRPYPSTASNKRDMTTQPPRDGYLLVEFFDSDEVASIKNSPDFIRPFQNGTIDAVIRKNKKKRNTRAVETCRQEEETTREVRNDAARYYAEKSFQCINACAVNGPAGLSLGTRVEIFRSDINYPVGAHLVGTVRMYSTATKKYLVAYDSSPRNPKHYDPTWINFTTQRYRVMDDESIGPNLGNSSSQRKTTCIPSDIDVYPFLFGYVEKDGSTGTKCRGCVSTCDPEQQVVLQCSVCSGCYHPGCLDPPMANRTAESILKNNEGGDQGKTWMCPKCIRCDGCRELEIVFGTKAISQPPPTLYLPRNSSLRLCVSCVPMYQKEMFCPICAHVWDDVRYQKVQRRMETARKKALSSSSSLPPKKRKTPVHGSDVNSAWKEGKVSLSPNSSDVCAEISKPEEGQLLESSFRWKLSQSINDSWFYPENDVWGYSEGTMLSCEKCNLWVHAGCAELSQTEYEQTTQGEHPVYSKEYLCRTCCKEKCIEMMNLLHEQDTMYLFAAPVTDKMAHNYSDIIKNPMDLQTMTDRAHIGNYRNYAWLRESFELMVYNALVFNPPQSKYWNEAKRYFYACNKSVFGTLGKGAPSTKYNALIKERFELAEKMVQDEKDRMKADKTTEKKDLVAGSEVLAVTVGPLVKPNDPPSCVLTTIVRMNKVDAFYSSWLECCFSCGSSGAIDTMLFCVDCGEAYHSFCVNAPIHSMNDAAVEGWRCPNCKLCEITGEVTDDETRLLYCEMCDRAFSLDLISPPLDSAPSGLWICGQCVDCKSCDNKSDNGVVRKTYWSRDPGKCLPCGGCDGLSLKSLEHSKCRVCKKLSRQTNDLPQCSTCNSFIHVECDKDAIESFLRMNSQKDKENSAKYSCPKCRKRAAIAAKRKEDVLKNKKRNKAKMMVKKEAPKMSLSKEEQREQALVIAMKEAQKRGLPDGWSVFYGSANRKRWRSPPPNCRVFDSIPKALLYAQRVKNGEYVSRSKKKDMESESAFKFFALKLDDEADWQLRERGYDESTSLMSDAEVLLKILEAKIDVNMSLIFDRSGKLFQSSGHLREVDLPKWVLARSGRFVRFVKRLRNRSARTTRRRGMMSNRSAQTVVCKMASAFIYCVCIMFKIDTKKTIRCWKKMESLLIAVDEKSGTVDLRLDDKKKKYTPTNLIAIGTNNSLSQTLKIPDGLAGERQQSIAECKQQAESLNQTMAQIPYHKLNTPPESLDHVPLRLPSLKKAQAFPSTSARLQMNISALSEHESFPPRDDRKNRGNTRAPAQKNMKEAYHKQQVKVPSTNCDKSQQKCEETSTTVMTNTPTSNVSPIKSKSSTHVPAFDPRSGKTENEYNIASALMMLTTTPTRVNNLTNHNAIRLQSTSKQDNSVDHHAVEFNGYSRQSVTSLTQNISHGFSTGDVNHQNNPPTTTPPQSRQVRNADWVALSDTKQAESAFNPSKDAKRVLHPDPGTRLTSSPLLGYRMGNVQVTSSHEAKAAKNTTIKDAMIASTNSMSHDANTADVTSCPNRTSLTQCLESMADAALLLSAANGVSSEQSMRNSRAIYSKVPSVQPNSTAQFSRPRPPIVAEVIGSAKPSLHYFRDSSASDLSRTKTMSTKSVPIASNSQLPDNVPKRDNPLDHQIASLHAGGTISAAPPICEQHITEKPDNNTLGAQSNMKSLTSMAPQPNLSTQASTVTTPSTVGMKKSVNSQMGSIARHDVTPVAPAVQVTLAKDNSSIAIGRPLKIGLDGSTSVKMKSTASEKVGAKTWLDISQNRDKVDLPWFSRNFLKVKPVMGWDSLSNGDLPGITKWVDSRTCCLCNIPGDDDVGLEPAVPFVALKKTDRIRGSGRLLPLPGGGWIHAMCALWSSEVWENPVGGILDGVGKAKARSTKLRCFGCGQIGATLGCHKSNCNANYHFPCAKACGAVFTSTHKFYCAAHAPKNDPKVELIEHFSEPMKILRVVDDRYEADPSLCYRTGSLVVHSLGTIEPDKDGFHSQHYITPAGFSSTRIFWSFLQPKTRTVYFMRITRSPENTAFFTLTAADSPSEVFRGYNVSEVYNDVMQRVRDMNKDFFSHGDLFSVYPMIRSKKNKSAFCLNGPQFFGFGINAIRKALEKSAHAASLIVPLSTNSTPYQFCFQNPTQQSVTDLQRKRALLKAEKDLENGTGCARTEGIGAIDKSKGSGRITRALVRSDKDYSSPSRSRALTKGAAGSSEGGRDPRVRNDLTSSREFESTQVKYREMKSVPMEQRLAAKRSHIHGWGLFAKKDYPKNSMIAEYMGEGISQPIADKREKMYEILGMGSCYMFRLDLNEIVDATQIGCMARFMNHCCSANAYANIITVNTERGLEKKIVVFANQDIKRGDEITYDYKFPVEDGSLRCTCGAPNCNGRMN